MQKITEAIYGRAMKKTFIITSMIIMAAIVAGCSKEKIEPENSIEEVSVNEKITLTVSAVTKNDPQTKVAYGSTDATWETGDKIFLIKSDGTTITLTISGGIGTSNGTFVSSDPVVAGTYIPYAVSASSLTDGLVSVTDGVITLDLTNPGGSTLADVLKHDILKGDALDLTNDQTNATITGLSTHILSYIRFTFNCAATGIESIGMDSAGGLYQTVTISTNGTVSGSNSSTDAIYTVASADGTGKYVGYFAVYKQTSISLMAHAFDESNNSYSRLVSTKTADYTAGAVYGKSFTLSDAMVAAAATGTLSDQNWKNLGLSVKWAEFNVGSSSEYSYDRNIDNGTSDVNGISVPAGWTGWRIPSREEVQELFYASQREWVTGSNNGVKFNCNGNYLAMGAGGYERWRDDGRDWDYNIGSTVYFYINENTPSNGWYAQIWATISTEGSTLGFGSANLGTNTFSFSNYAAMRLVCDY
jgi:hypothetical protein